MGTIDWVLGVDPGRDHIALASFSGGALTQVVFFTRKGAQLPEDLSAFYKDPEVLVIEKMQYQGTKTAKDILDVAFTGGEVLGLLTPDYFEHPTPAQWKGSTPKPIHHLRIAEAVPGAREMVAKLPKGQQGHVWDAIGLGWWYVCGRKKL